MQNYMNRDEGRLGDLYIKGDISDPEAESEMDEQRLISFRQLFHIFKICADNSSVGDKLVSL
jgi:hypothetical protein